ncbi:hypothetical protein THAOC_35537 [Thalassiosira oceanica]|uniref:Uncharacterized protein n=1 Tax=Thalassiosira oceanica TaxID=159749 RepID=K0R0R6_THAOC|nr:hypothetical protein THAOC_35537 [Thalassiosira oceanica]|eukprot:EJK45828.1 hypothetical protein THAOC_35537 [Thalassiosira oceanica]
MRNDQESSQVILDLVFGGGVEHRIDPPQNKLGGRIVTQDSKLDPCLDRRHAVPFSLQPVASSRRVGTYSTNVPSR